MPQAKNVGGKGITLPGQPTEEAVAEVGSEAGKSLLRGLARLGSAAVDGWVSKKEARAAAAKLAIETEAAIAKEQALTQARRQEEIQEIEHHALLHRRAQRIRLEFEREQRNLEAVEVKAIEFTEGDTENANARELDDDWLFRFSDLAQHISDDQVQGLWARALSSASITGATKLSGASLQTLSLFDKHIADSFERFAL